MSKPKILIFTYHTTMTHEGKTFEEVGNLTLSSKQDYCNRHGYDFVCKTDNFTSFKKNRVIGWERIDMFLEYLDSYEWVWMLGADTMIMNQTIKLEDIIDDNYDMILARNFNNKDIIEINSDSWLVKSSEWSRNFLNKINKKEHLYNTWGFEQSAAIEELNNNTETLKHIKLVHNRVFNSYWHHWHIETNNFKFGDFVLHDAGTSNQHRFDLFNEMKNKIVKDNNTDYSDWKIETLPFI